MCGEKTVVSLPAGTKLGPYEIVAPLGAGGMGVVYRARDLKLGRTVAVKVLSGDFSSDSQRTRRFEQEARAAGMLNHPNVLAVYDLGRHGTTDHPTHPERLPPHARRPYRDHSYRFRSMYSGASSYLTSFLIEKLVAPIEYV